MSETKEIYVIKQHQPEAGYQGEVILAFEEYEEAVLRCKKLNKKYGYGCTITKDFRKYRVKKDCLKRYKIHAYTIDTLILNPIDLYEDVVID